jgi:hypothetical protein
MHWSEDTTFDYSTRHPNLPRTILGKLGKTSTLRRMESLNVIQQLKD